MKETVTEENDTIARQIDQFVRSCNKQLHNIAIANNDDELKSKMLEMAKAHYTELEKRRRSMESMGRKAEIKRLDNIKLPLVAVIDRLSPNEDEADYFRSLKNDEEILSDNEESHHAEEEEEEEEDDDYEDEEEDDEDEDEDDEESEYSEDEETEDITASTVKSLECEAIETFLSQEPGDLSFKKGEMLTVTSQRRDGWWEAEHRSSGKRGLVPSNFMKLVTLEKSMTQNQPRQPGAMRELLKNTAFDALRSSGCCNTGSRASSMIQFLQDSDIYLLSTWLHPRLSGTCISFKDLHWDMNRNNIVPVTSVNRIVTLNMVRNIPSPKPDSQIINRRVHMAVTTRLSNKKLLLSNIHTVNCVWSATDANNWKFVKNNGSLYHPKVLCRLESTDANLGLLLEACSVHKTPEGDFVEVGVGWSFLPLFQTNGAPVPNKTQALPLNGGVTFESGVEVDDDWPLRRTFGKPGKPQIGIGISAVSRFQEGVVSRLPSTLLASTLNIKTISLFRRALGETLLKDNERCQNGVIFDPTLSLILQMSDQPVLMDLFKKVYLERCKPLRRVDKKDAKFMRKHLETVLKDVIWPLVNGTTTQLAHDYLTRGEIAERTALANAVAAEGALTLFLKDGPHTPFDVSELCYVPVYREHFVSL